MVITNLGKPNREREKEKGKREKKKFFFFPEHKQKPRKINK